MICPECRDGFVSEPTPKPFVITYRSFSKTLVSTVDIDAERLRFQREVNRQLSIGELV